MTHPAHDQELADEIPSWQSLFSAQDWNGFRADDHHTARNIVCLMAGIFTTGLGLYLVIAYICAQ